MNRELTLGEVRAMYFDADALRLPELTMYRFDIRGNRNYFCFPESIDPPEMNAMKDAANGMLESFGHDPIGKEPVFMTGVTTLTHRMIPKQEALIRWMADKGYDEAIAFRDLRAKYGTLMHTVFAKFLMDKKVDLNLIDSVVDAYILQHKLYEVSVAEWAHDLKQDLLSFAQFCIDYKIKPLAIEVTLGHHTKKFAGTVDLVCKMTVEEKGFWGEEYASGAKKGQPKETQREREVYAIIDFKSGRNSSGGIHNAAQLYFYADLVEHTWEDINIERMYNWNPKDWRTKPGYTLSDQTESYSREQAEHLLELFRLENKLPEENTRLVMNGELVFSTEQEFGPENNYSVKTIQELAMESIEANDGVIEPWHYDDFESLVIFNQVEE